VLAPSGQAGTITFAEFAGLGDNSAIPSPPAGLPPDVTATWTGLVLHTTAGDTPMSVFPADDTGASITFSSPVWITSINVFDTSWGGPQDGSPVKVTGQWHGTNVWVYTSPGDHNFEKVTDGAGKAIDKLLFAGRWNHYDDIVVDPLYADADADGLNDFWEFRYFPNDLTKLSANGDFDGDGLKDGEEATLGTDPTKADTDGDGLSDKVETNTGVYVSASNTGTNPLKADTDGDGLNDKVETNTGVYVSPTNTGTDPLVADTDLDTFGDGDEVKAGHNPTDANDNPELSALANSRMQFSGVQGQDDWYSGYRDYTADGGGDTYNPDTGFIPFKGGANDPTAWDGINQMWNGTGWDLNSTGAPWTELYSENTHPNGANSGHVHWTIRRWAPTTLGQTTPFAIRWHVHKNNTACGNGVTGALYINGRRVDAVTLAANDNVGVTHTFYANIALGDKIDLTLSPRGGDASDNDGCDSSVFRFLIDPILPADPRQPDGSIFVPVGAGDSDADGLPDVWETSYFPGDLKKLSGTGDYDKDGLNDLGEYLRGSDPTKADTDGDGLSDLVETKTGIYLSKTNTGSDPTKVDSDGDGISDAAEVNRTPPINPNKSDTDGDGYSDPDEIAWGTDPTNAADNPVAFVIANSETEFSGVQGQNGWYSGYRLFNPQIGTIDYDRNQDFIPFPGGSDNPAAWDGVTQTWNNGSWALGPGSSAPWTMEGPLAVHPNGTNSAADPTKEQWPIRRWVASELTSNTTVTIIWKVRKTNLNNEGVTGMVFVNGKLADSKVIAGNDGVGEMRRYSTVLKKGDVVDLALSPVGPGGDRFDYSDGSETWFWADTRPLPPKITLARPVVNSGAGTVVLRWSSTAGASYTVFISSDLKTWTQQSVPSGGTETIFTDTLGTPRPAARFYRVSQP